MVKLEVGQELEFFEDVRIGERVISKGTRARVGALMPELIEQQVTLVIHGRPDPEVITVERHFVTLHSLPVPGA